MAKEKNTDKFNWKDGDVTVKKLVINGKVVKELPKQEKPKKK